MMKKLYLFDFDGTITKKDTMFLFLNFVNPSKYRIQFLLHIPLFILLKLGLADAEKVKKSFVSSLLKGKSEKKLKASAQQFFDLHHESIMRQTAVDFIHNIDHELTDSYIVSASLDIWVQPFADYYKLTLISTKAEFVNGYFTGDFSTPNCNGIEKVNRIKEELQGKKFDKKIAFGDTEGDRAMLNFADEGHFRFFH